jgi:hypothetical protein
VTAGRPELAADLHSDAAILDPYPLYRDVLRGHRSFPASFE